MGVGEAKPSNQNTTFGRLMGLYTILFYSHTLWLYELEGGVSLQEATVAL